MLSGLDASKKAMVIMDAGIATEENVQWLSDNGYRYLVVSRKSVTVTLILISQSASSRHRGSMSGYNA